MKNKIINYLRIAEKHVSGEHLSGELKISRSAIWKNIEELRKEGYEIEATPNLGYILKNSPDKLLPREILSNLNTKYVGKQIHYFDSLESTMDRAIVLALNEEPEGSIVITESQSRGKGRMGRSWVSPKSKGIYTSIILRPKYSPSEITKFAFLTSVAVCEAINQFAGCQTNIKWPNDILLNGKKICGILTELNAEVESIRFLIIGVGINVNTSVSHLPQGATSLKNELKDSFNRVELCQKLLQSIEFWYDKLNNEGFDPIIKRWKELNITLGSKIKFNDQNGQLEGQAVDLDEYGGLLIQSNTGTLIKKMSGDVIHVG